VDQEDAQYRAGRVVIILSHDEICELRRLFSQIGNTCDVACQSLQKKGSPPTESEFQRFKELTAHLTVAVERINSIIG